MTSNRAWKRRAVIANAVGTVYGVSLAFFIVLSMMFVTLAYRMQKTQTDLAAATCSLPTSITTTIELTPTDSDNIVDCSSQDITITSTGKLIIKSFTTADTSTSNDGGVVLKVGSLTIDVGGEISADGQGYVTGATDGGSATASTGISGGSGGGNGGAGGIGNTIGGEGNVVGSTGGVIGSKDTPLTLGGAGGTSGGGGVGGTGGGAVKIEASGTVTINGLISANGSAGAKSGDGQTAGGGGAGGSIWVEAQTLAGSGTVRANGGGTDQTASYFGGGGGGGRVALICSASTTFPSGNVSVAAGTGSQNGQVGTLLGPGCRPSAPTVLKFYEKNATAGKVDRELAVTELTTKTALTFASDLAGSDLKLEVEIREKAQSFTNIPTAGQVTAASNKTCTGIPTGNGVTIGTYCGYIEVTSGFTTSTEYKWQARITSTAGISSSWVQYGGNGTSDADFTIVGAAASIIVVEGNEQSAVVGQLVSVKPKARVVDAAGYGVPFYALTGWSVLTGSGSLSNQVNTADKWGEVTTDWTLGTTAGVGNNSIKIYRSSPALSRTFTASAVAGAIASYQVIPSDTLELINTAFSYTITAKDTYGNVVPFVDTLSIVPVSSADINTPGLGTLAPSSVAFSGEGAVDGSSGTITISNATYSYSESIKVKVYDALGNVGYSSSILFVTETGSCPSITIDVDQTWNAVDAPGGVFDCRGYGTLTVKAGYTLTLNSYDSGDTNYQNDFGVTILADAFSVESTGKITATAKGYRPQLGPGTGYRQGASYGGYGASGGTTPYGNMYEPSHLGSAGNSSGYYGTAGYGGGAIKLQTTGTTTINGSVESNGTGGAYAGTGGSIWINTNTLAGSGTIIANGGTSSGGAGGRIAIYYTTNSGFSLTPTYVHAYGGMGTNGGGAGTVYYEQVGTDPVHGGTLMVDNNNQNSQYAAVTSGNYSLKEIKVSRYGHVEFMGDTSVLNLSSASGFVGDDTKPKIKISGTLEYTGAGTLNIDGVDLGINGKANGLQDIQVGGTYPAGLTLYGTTWFHNPSNPYSFRDILVKGNGTVTMAGVDNGNSTWTDDYGPVVTARNITVEASGKISADGKGYTPYRGPGTSENTPVAYGGYAVSGSNQPYGSVYEPDDLGSPGSGSGYYGAGGNGGGAMKLVLSGTLTNDGIISSNGLTGSWAGTGGSIWIDTATLAGSGTITADGGSANGPSGGRIALYYTTNSGFTIAPSNVHAFGGGGAGGAGTVYYEDKSVDPVHGGILMVDNNSHNTKYAAVLEGTYNFKQIKVTRYGHVEFLGNNSILILNSASGFSGDDTKPVVKISGTLQYTGTGTLVMDGVDLGLHGKADGLQDIQLGGTYAAGLTLYGTTWYHNPSNPYTFRDILVKSNGIMTMTGVDNGNSTWTDDYGPVLNARNLTIENGGQVTADGKGYTPYRGPGTSENTPAAYGGYPVSGGNQPYGDIYQPDDLGSPGSGSGFYGPGGAGGGAMKLVLSGTLTNDGTITADGLNGSWAGTGGSIWIDTSVLTGNGTITADGAANNGPGGGRIAVYYGTNTNFVLEPSNVHAFGGAGGGGAGTVYLEHKNVDTAFGGTLRIDNNNLNARSAAVLSGTYQLKEIKVTRYGHVEFLGNDSVLTVNSPAGFLGDSTKPIIKISGTLLYTGTGTLTIDGVDLGLNGKVEGVQDFSIGGTNAAGLTLYGKTWYHNPSNPYSFRDILVNSNGTMSLASVDTGDSNWTDDYGPYLNAHDITVESGGKITATGRGYTPYRGPYTAENTAVSYGGYGAAGRAVYGNVFEPTDIGTAGSGSGFYGPGGSSGGAMKLTLTGTLTNNGSIESNGTNGSWSGTGGSIWIDTNTLAGSGTITADGGTSWTSPSGGRIAIYYGTNSGFTLNSSKIHAFGGSSDYSGGPGTVYIENKGVDAVHGGILLIDNNNINTTLAAGVLTGDYAFKNIQLTRKGNVEFLGSDSTITIDKSSALSGDNTKPNLVANGTFTYTGTSALTISGVNLSVKGKDVGFQDVVIGGDQAAGLNLYAHTWWYSPTERHSFSNLVIGSNGTLTVNSYDNGNSNWTDDYGAIMSVNNLTIDNGGVLTATGGGYAASKGPGIGTNGPSHGGYGYGQQAASYGDLYEPITMGSGGSYAGGGALKLTITNALINNGTISSNGANGAVGGAGGSIWIDTSSIDGTGIIAADGGISSNGYPSAGGGRVAIYFDRNNGFTLAASHVHAYGGHTSDNNYYGGPGTVYFEDRVNHREKGGDLVLDNNGSAGRSQTFAAGTYLFNNVTIGQNVTAWVQGNPEVASTPISTTPPHSYIPDSSTVAAYDFNDSVTDYADASGNGHRASGGSNITFANGKFGSAQRVVNGGYGLMFDPITLTTDYTIDMWAKFPLPSTPDGWRTFAQGSTGHQIIVSSDGQLGIYNSGFYSSGYNVNSLTGWHHLANVTHGSSTKFYIDGQYVGTSSSSVFGTFGVIGNGATNQAAGVIDEVRVTNKAMSDSEVATAAAATQAYTPTAQTLGLWHLDEHAAGLADSSSNSNTASIVGTVTRIAGKFGSGRSLTTNGAYLTMDPVALTGDWTIGMWVKFPLPATSDGWRTLIARASGTYHHIIVSSAGQLGMYNNGWVDSGYNVNFLDGWHHVAEIASGSSTTFYIDGIKAGNTVSGHITEPVSSIGNVVSGNIAQSAGGIDEVHIWNRALTTEEIGAVGTATIESTADNNTIGLWHFNETDPVLHDLSSNHQDASVYGTVTSAGKIGATRQFLGTKDYVQLPASTMNFSGGMTIAFWAKPTSQGSYARFIDLGNGCPSDNIIISRSGTSNDLLFETFQGTGSQSYILGTNGIINDEWHHYAFTIDATNHASIYRDGVLFTSGTVTVPQTLLRNYNYVGKSCSGSDALYAGYIDELTIANTVKSGEEIQAMMAGLTVSELGNYQQELTGQGVIFDLTGDFSLASGAFIKGIGTGFTSDNGQGRGNRGLGYSGGGGGANGGNGGSGQSDGSNPAAVGGTKYGDQLLPITLGSGGGSSAVGAAGGAGGGAFAVIARGKLVDDVYVHGGITVSGTINMDGSTGKTGSPGGGGGAGGSILLHGNTCNVTGTLSARGGEGGNSDIDGGSGGGGHVSVLYNVGPCDVSGTVAVEQGTPSDPGNYSAQVGQIGTHPPSPNTVPWPSQYQGQFEIIENGLGMLPDGKTVHAQTTTKADVLGITESAIPVGGIINGTTVTLKADAYETGASALTPKRLRIQVELKKTNQAFDGTTNVTNSSTYTFTGGQPVVLSVTVSNLEMGASYKWRARTINVDSGLTSDWQEYGGNGSNEADFTITTVSTIDLMLSTSRMELSDSASITVVAKNESGDTDTSYRGTIKFSSNSGTATLPANYTFTEADAGTHTFTDALKFFEEGTFTVTVEDTVNPVLVDTANITVDPTQVPYLLLSSSADLVTFGNSVTLTWSSSLLSNLTIDNGIGSVSASGTREVTPPLGETTYTITGTKGDGSHMTASVTVTATQEFVPTTTHTATATPTPTGTATTTVTPTVTGSVTPTPTARPRPSMVVVTCPTIVSFTVSNKIIKKNGVIDIDWEVKNADKVSIDALSSALPLSGNASISPVKTVDITLFAQKGTCKRSQTKHLDVVATYPWEGAGTMLVGLLAVEMVGMQIGTAQGNIWFALLGLIDRSKKRKPWGVVYDSVSKKLLPRAIVRLWDTKTGQLVDTVVTDANGIFKLTPKKGAYVIKVVKTGYLFPSKLIKTDTDSGYTNIYTGEVIEVQSENDILMLSIPLDPEKRKGGYTEMQQVVNLLEEVVGVISPVILTAGFIYSLIVTVMYPLTLNYIILLLYILTFLIKVYVYVSRPKVFGTVTSVDGRVVSGLEIGLFDKEFKNLISRTFTNKNGAYNFVVRNQDYYLQILDPGYKLLSRNATKDGMLISQSHSNSGVKLVAESILVYPVQRMVKK